MTIALIAYYNARPDNKNLEGLSYAGLSITTYIIGILCAHTLASIVSRKGIFVPDDRFGPVAIVKVRIE